MRESDATLWTLPNVVSMSRVVLAAGFLASAGTGERAMLIGVASLTDFLDGWLARRRNAVSRWGALLDPIADRVFVLTAVTTLALSGQLTWLQYAVLLFRDVMTAIGFIVARIVRWLRPVNFRARPTSRLQQPVALAPQGERVVDHRAEGDEPHRDDEPRQERRPVERREQRRELQHRHHLAERARAEVDRAQSPREAPCRPTRC